VITFVIVNGKKGGLLVCKHGVAFEPFRVSSLNFQLLCRAQNSAAFTDSCVLMCEVVI